MPCAPRERLGLRGGDTAVVLQIGVRLTRYCPCLAVRFRHSL